MKLALKAGLKKRYSSSQWLSWNEDHI